MQWPWRKVEIKTVYVPVPSFGAHEDLWGKQGYLQDLINVSKSVPWIAEMTQLLKEVRDLLDNAKTPEEIKGISACTTLVKMRVTIESSAANILNSLVIQEKMRAENEQG